ncbi:uncharacterized protein LOC144156171 [Haemaphysalis longicornis]
MRKKRRPCFSLASREEGDAVSGVGMPDASVHGAANEQRPASKPPATMHAAGANEQRLVTKPVHSDESLVELFALIESNPCLWKNDSRGFKNLRLKRHLWDRFATHLTSRFPMLGPFTPDNLRYVYSIKRRQYYDELKEKTVRTKTGELEYNGRWKFFDCLSFLRVHSEPFRVPVISPLLHFEQEQMIGLEEDGDEPFVDDVEASMAETDESSILPDNALSPAVLLAKEENPVTPRELIGPDVPSSCLDVPPVAKKARVSADAKSLAVPQQASGSGGAGVPRVDSVQSLNAVSGYYDECDQFGNIIANYMRRLSEQDRLEFHCHIMSCTKDFFSCFSRFTSKRV